MKVEDILINKIVRYCKITGVSERQFCLAVCNNHKLLSNLRKGKTINSGTINAIRDYIKKNKKPSRKQAARRKVSRPLSEEGNINIT